MLSRLLLMRGPGIVGSIAGGDGLDLLDHAEKSIGPGGREILSKPDLLNEVWRGGGDLLFVLSGIDPHEQGDQSFGYEGITVSLEYDGIPLFPGMQPNLTDTALHLVVLVTEFFRECRQFLP